MPTTKSTHLEIALEVEEEEVEWGFEEEQVQEPQSPIELSASSMAGVVGVGSIRLVEKSLGKEVSFTPRILSTRRQQRGWGCHFTPRMHLT